MSLWNELDTIQKKKTDLEFQLTSLEERSKILEQKLKDQEEHANRLMEQLKSNGDVIGRLESTITDLERRLKKPETDPGKMLEVPLVPTG